MEDPTVPAPQDKEWFAKEDWLARHEQLLAESRKKGDGCELVFLGDSITEGWMGEGLATWRERYAEPYGAVDLGIGGDEVQHVTWRVQNGEVDALSPKVAVILIGTNNIGNVGHKAGPVAAGVRMLLDELRARLPTTKLLVMATFPRDPAPGTPFRQEIEELNGLVRKFRDGQHIFVLDIGPEFFSDRPDFIHTFREGGAITDDVMPDFLHLSAKGYQIWADAMAPILERLMAAERQLPPEQEPYLTRSFEPADLEQVHALFAAGMRFYHDHGISEKMRLGWEKYIQHAIDDDLSVNMDTVFLSENSNFWCTVDQRLDSPTFGDLIGIVGGEELGREGAPGSSGKPWPVDNSAERTMELRRMSVHINSRGLGLATHLVETLEEFARRRGFERVVLTTGMVMKQAQLLYEACGYTEVHRSVYPEALEDPDRDPETEGFVGFEKKLAPARL